MKAIHNEDGYHCWKGNHWMVQFTEWAGPLNLGIHISLGDTKYIDIHLPYLILTVGGLLAVEYPPEWWNSSRDYRSGVKYDHL